MKSFGLLGYPLSHSFSKPFYEKKFEEEGLADISYQNFSIEHIEDAVELLKGMDTLAGFNITIPHKEHILPYLEEMEPICKEIRSCNCVKVVGDRWIGYNTDVVGFRESIRPLLKQHHSRALVLGTGGASKAVVYGLQQLQIKPQLVSRSKKDHTITYSEVTPQVIADHTMIINTTPVGMFPHQDECPHIPYDTVSDKHLFFDLIYNPEETLFLQKAREKGAVVKNGYEMLLLQGEEIWKIWKK